MGENSRRSAFVAVVAGAPFIFGCVEPWAASLMAFVLAVLAVEVSFGCGFDYTSLAAASPFFLAIIVGLIQIVSPVPADSPVDGFAATVSRHATLWAITMWGALAAAAVLSRRLVVDRRTVISVFWAISIVASLISFIGVLQALSGTGSLYWIRPIPSGSYLVFGPYYNRNHAGNLFLMALPLAVYAFWDSVRRGSYGLEGVARATVLFFPIAVIFCGVVACGSLASLVLAVLGFVTMSGLLWRKKAHLWLLLAFGLVLGGICAYNARVIFAHHSVSTRLSLWRSSLLMSSDFPLMGRGLGGFEIAFRPYQESVLLGFGDHAHNDWLELACEVGRPAALAIGLGLAGIAIFGIWGGREDRSPEMAAGVAAVAFMAHAAIDFPLHIPANGVIFSALIGISSNRSLRQWREIRPRAIPLAILFSAFTLLCLWEISTRGAADAVLIKARSENSFERRERLERLAYWLDPGGARPTHGLASELARRGALSGEKSQAVEALQITTRHLNVEPWNASLILSRAHALRSLGRGNDSLRDILDYFTLVPWAKPPAGRQEPP